MAVRRGKAVTGQRSWYITGTGLIAIHDMRTGSNGTEPYPYMYGSADRMEFGNGIDTGVIVNPARPVRIGRNAYRSILLRQEQLEEAEEQRAGLDRLTTAIIGADPDSDPVPAKTDGWEQRDSGPVAYTKCAECGARVATHMWLDVGCPNCLLGG